MPVISFNLGLPNVPETANNELRNELIRVYNAINQIAQVLDLYTGSGQTMTDITTIQTQLAAIAAGSTAGKFTTLEASAGFGVNGKSAQSAVTLPANATDLATAIILINSIKATLIANGIGA